MTIEARHRLPTLSRRVATEAIEDFDSAPSHLALDRIREADRLIRIRSQGRTATESRLLRQNRVEHGFCRRQHVFGNRLSIGMQIQRP